MFKRGDFVEVDGLLAVVVGTDDDGGAPEDHLALWFGTPQGRRRSEGGGGSLMPEVWTVPSDCCIAAMRPDIRH